MLASLCTVAAMKKFKTLLLCVAVVGSIAAQDAAPAEEPASAEPQRVVNKRAVFAVWPNNGAFYKGDVIDEKDGKSLIQWAPGNGGTLEPSWVDNGEVFGTLEALIYEGKKPREVYAMYSTGYYYKGVAILDRGENTLVYWADGSAPMWVPKKNVKSRKGHGLKKTDIADRELTPAEKAQEAKANAKASKERAAQFTPQCRTYRTQLDCLRTFDPCTWTGGRCQYRGY
jgi:hypothetical protein